MDGLNELAVAMAVFVGGHFLLSSQPVRGRLAGTLGEGGFAIGYSILSLAAFIWMLLSFGNAPHVELWPAPPALRTIPMMIMPLAVLFIVGGYTQPNPTAVGQSLPAGEPPVTTGILTFTRHPVMWGVGLWALAHIPPNGDAASLILFGGMAVLALGGTVAIDAKRRDRDPVSFAHLAAVTSNVPFLAIKEGRAQMAGLEKWRLLLAAAVYFGLLIAHPWIAGVPAI